MITPVYASQATQVLEWMPMRLIYGTLLVDGVFLIVMALYGAFRIWKRRCKKDRDRD